MRDISCVLVGAAFLTASYMGSSAYASKDCEAPPRVSEVYPTGDELPENLLRFYVYFSRAMARRTEAIERVQIENAAGNIVTGAFLPTRFALWSPDRTRLTLLLDPGRVKTGLAAHQAMGRALRSGKRYTVVVPSTLRDSQGCALGATYRKAFTATKADLSPPTPSRWRLTPPPAGTLEPLKIALDGNYDHLSLAFRLRVKGPGGGVVAGAIGLLGSETSWSFRPRSEWAAANYTINIDPALEDLAGNRIDSVFDRPAASIPLQQKKVIHTLTFRPK